MSAREYVEHVGLRVHEGHARCRFCHQWFPISSIPQHDRTHTKRGADGQMESHLTLPPEQRYQGHVVEMRWYIHMCGEKTGMPEEYIRSLLADPFIYGDCTFCTGCGDYFPWREFTWEDDGENVGEYVDRLQAEFRSHHPHH